MQAFVLGCHAALAGDVDDEHDFAFVGFEVDVVAIDVLDGKAQYVGIHFGGFLGCVGGGGLGFGLGFGRRGGLGFRFGFWRCLRGRACGHCGLGRIINQRGRAANCRHQSHRRQTHFAHHTTSHEKILSIASSAAQRPDKVHKQTIMNKPAKPRCRDSALFAVRSPVDTPIEKSLAKVATETRDHPRRERVNHRRNRKSCHHRNPRSLPSAVHVLRRTVRVNVLPAGSAAGAKNTYAGYPTMTTLGAFYSFEVAVRGEPNADTGYLRDIKHIDRAVRETVVPTIATAFGSATAEPAELLANTLPALNRAIGGGLQSVRWFLSPYYSLEVAMPAAPQAEQRAHRVLIRERFDFAAAHRLHVPQHSDDANRATLLCAPLPIKDASTYSYLNHNPHRRHHHHGGH